MSDPFHLLLLVLDHWKSLSALIIALLTASKSYLRGQGNWRPHRDQHEQLTTFFKAGGIHQHPILVEHSFGAVMGHTKLGASEIALLLRQTDPTNFIRSYMRVRTHLRPASSLDCFELSGTARHQALRISLTILGIIIYVIAALPAAYALLTKLPDEILHRSWPAALSTVVACGILGVFAIIVIYETGRLNGAKKLFDSQVSPRNEERSDQAGNRNGCCP